MITVGLDFGTHQTKVCIEEKNGAELSYTFFKFMDTDGQLQYAFPSIINVREDGRLEYGFISPESRRFLIRYFKQSTFRNTPESPIPQEDAMMCSIWYIAYIIFELEEKYGQAFTIQMGAPTDSSHVDEAKRTAVRLLASAYYLVEEVFRNDKQAFLDTPMEKLKEVTEIKPYSKETKDEFSILVFPEAYASLNPLISRGKIANGMSLMVDIGGGTTDISFFTIENGLPQVYDYFSLNMGLNYLTDTSAARMSSRNDSNVQSEEEIINERFNLYTAKVDKECRQLVSRIASSFQSQTKLRVDRLYDALKTRPIVYCGGGSTFKRLRRKYGGFKERHLVSEQEWDIRSVNDMDDIRAKRLCPILSTAYGLAISRATDKIEKKPLRDIFAQMRGYEEDIPVKKEKGNSTFGIENGDFDYGTDWDAWK